MSTAQSANKQDNAKSSQNHPTADKTVHVFVRQASAMPVRVPLTVKSHSGATGPNAIQNA